MFKIEIIFQQRKIAININMFKYIIKKIEFISIK